MASASTNDGTTLCPTSILVGLSPSESKSAAAAAEDDLDRVRRGQQDSKNAAASAASAASASWPALSRFGRVCGGAFAKEPLTVLKGRGWAGRKSRRTDGAGVLLFYKTSGQTYDLISGQLFDLTIGQMFDFDHWSNA